MKDTIQEYQGKIYELLDQNRIFNGILVLAQNLTSEGQACNVEGGCEMHQRRSNGVCIIPDNVVQGVQIFHEHVLAEERITLECRIRQSDDGATVSGLHLASDSDSMSENYMHFGELLATSRAKAKSLQTELNDASSYGKEVLLCAPYMENCLQLAQYLAQVRADACGDRAAGHVVSASVQQHDVRDLFKPRKPLLLVLSIAQADFHKMCRKLRFSTAGTRAIRTQTAARRYRFDASLRASKQAVHKHSKTDEHFVMQQRSWKKQTPSRAAYETAEQYCQRRFEELKTNPNPQLSDVVDYENNPAAALVVWYLKSNLATRHEPPACFTTDIFMLHQSNLYDFDRWSDTDLNVIRVYNVLASLVAQAKWLRIAAECRHALQWRRDNMEAATFPVNAGLISRIVPFSVPLSVPLLFLCSPVSISFFLFSLFSFSPSLLCAVSFSPLPLSICLSSSSLLSPSLLFSFYLSSFSLSPFLLLSLSSFSLSLSLSLSPSLPLSLSPFSYPFSFSPLSLSPSLFFFSLPLSFCFLFSPSLPLFLRSRSTLSMLGHTLCFSHHLILPVITNR